MSLLKKCTTELTYTLKMTFLEKSILAKLHTGIVKMQWVCFSLCVNTPTQQHPDCEFKRKTTKNKRLPSKVVLAVSQSTKVGATLLQTHQMSRNIAYSFKEFYVIKKIMTRFIFDILNLIAFDTNYLLYFLYHVRICRPTERLEFVLILQNQFQR